MAFILHTTDLSPFGQRAKLALRAKGLLGDTELNDTFGGTDPLGELAPMRQIPILEHDGFVLPESQTIVEYLDEIAPQPAFLPDDPKVRANARLLSRIADLYIAPHFLSLIVGMRPPPRPEEMNTAFEKLNRGLSFAETYLSNASTYAVGDALSVADIALAPFMFYVPRLAEWHDNTPFPDTPKCRAYLERISKDPHIAAAFSEIDAAYTKRVAQLRAEV